MTKLMLVQELLPAVVSLAAALHDAFCEPTAKWNQPWDGWVEPTTLSLLPSNLQAAIGRGWLDADYEWGPMI